MKRVLFLFGTIIGVLVALGLAAVVGVYFWAVRDLPGCTRIADYRPALTTTVLARDGSVIGSFYRENRFLISLDQMPKMLPKAFLAAEDAEFYEHEGVNPVAIFRAFLINLQSGTKRQGGSTITQQVIKRLLLTPERSYERKIKEAILAYRLEHYLSKDEILTIYLNQTFLGANAYGVEAAARTYFGKNAKDLTLAECALIAGLPKAPSQYNPYRDPSAAIGRQHYVLRRLRELNWITEAEYDAALKQPLVFKQMADGMGRQGAWYLEEVRRQLIDLFSEENAKRLGIELPVYGEDAVYQMGFTVQTAMSPPAQMAADEALRSGLEDFTRRQGWQGPVEKIPVADLKERIEKSHFSPDMLANGERVKGIVTRITDKGADIRLGKYSGFIDNAQLSWAKKTLRSKQKFLESGDVVWVAAVSDPKNPYNPDEAELNKPIRLSLQCVPELQGALISIEPETGDVVAMVGGYSFQESQFNRATQAFRQPGSSFKPIVYSAALTTALRRPPSSSTRPWCSSLRAATCGVRATTRKTSRGRYCCARRWPCPATCALSAWCSRWGSRKSLSGPRIWSWSRISPKCCRSASVRSRLRR